MTAIDTVNPSPDLQDENEMIDLFKTLDLEKYQMDYLSSRWLETVQWSKKNAERTRRRYHLLRYTTLVGAMATPVLVLLINSPNPEPIYLPIVRMVVVVISIVLAISVVLADFLDDREQWHRYRSISEKLLAAGWEYFILNDESSLPINRRQGFNSFVNRVENILREQSNDLFVYKHTEKTDEVSIKEAK